MNQNNIYQKLHTIQSKLNHLTKTEENKFQHYKYVSEYQILTILKPLLVENKLTLTFSDEEYISSEYDAISTFKAEKQEKEWIVRYLKKAILTNTENPAEQLTFHFWATGQNTDIAKAKGSAETYAVKYFLQKLFLIPTSDNLDPDKIDKREVVASKELTEKDREIVNDFLKKHNYGKP